jgi:hypothetical protein
MCSFFEADLLKLKDFFDTIFVLLTLLYIAIDWVVILGFFAFTESMLPNLRCCFHRFHS